MGAVKKGQHYNWDKPCSLPVLTAVPLNHSLHHHHPAPCPPIPPTCLFVVMSWHPTSPPLNHSLHSPPPPPPTHTLACLLSEMTCNQSTIKPLTTSTPPPPPKHTHTCLFVVKADTQPVHHYHSHTHTHTHTFACLLSELTCNQSTIKPLIAYTHIHTCLFVVRVDTQPVHH